MTLTTIELFAGIGGFRLAADKRGIRTLWANDVCPKACAVYRGNFGATGLCEGDIDQWLPEVPPHDVLTGGFPCQPFSSAGKKMGIRDPRGTLFHRVVQCIEKHRPRFFILENVKRLLTMERGLHFATVLSSLAELSYRIEWRLLNAMHLGLPQNRQRIFILGIRRGEADDDGMRPRLAGPADLAELDADSLCILNDSGEWQDIGNHGRRFPNWGVANEGRFFGCELESFSAALPPVLLREVLEANVAREFDFTEATLKWLPNNAPVNRFVQGVEILSNQSGGARMGYTIFGIDGVAPTLTSTTSRHYERYRIDGRYRRLTNVEYARIQGFPDDHCRHVSVYDQYPLFGNAVPPPMSGWVMDRMLEAGVAPNDVRRRSRQRTLFEHAH